MLLLLLLLSRFSCVQLFAIPWITARQASLSITNSQSSHKLMCIKSVMPSSHLILWRPLLLLPPIPLSIRVFSNESALRMRWPKYWSFSFSIIPSPGLISFRMDWLDLLAVQGTFKCLLQHHSLKATVRTGHGTTDRFQIGKGVRQGCFYCHAAYLTSMQSTSWETLDWMKHWLESRLPGEISITSDIQMMSSLQQKAKKN